MTVLRICGFESGFATTAAAASETNTAITNTASIVTSGQRTGGFGFRANPTGAATGFLVITGLGATGLNTNVGTTQVCGFAFKAATLPSANEEIIFRLMGASSGATRVELRVASDGTLKLYKTVGAVNHGNSSAGVIVAGTWYYIEIKTVAGTTGSCEVRVDGTAVINVSGVDVGTETSDGVRIGKVANTHGRTVDFYYDDLYLDDSTFLATTMAFPEIRALLPNAAGASAGWTNGTGTTFAEVDTQPGDGTTYIQASATEDNLYSTFRCESTATKGVTGTILAVQGMVHATTASGSGSSAVGLRIRNSTTNSDTTTMELQTAYQSIAKCLPADPATGSAWTLGGVDTVEIGMVAGTLAQTQRFDQATIFVLALVSTSLSQSLDPGALIVAGVDPTISGTGTATVTLDPAALTLVGVEPEASVGAGAGQQVDLDPATLTLAGVDPVVSASGSVAVTVDPAVLLVTSVDITITGSGAASVAIDAGVFTLAGVDAAIVGSGSTSVSIDVGALTFVAINVSASATGSVTVAIDTGTLILTGVDVGVAATGTTSIAVDVGVLVLVAVDPTASASGAATIAIDTGALSLSGVDIVAALQSFLGIVCLATSAPGITFTVTAPGVTLSVTAPTVELVASEVC